MRGDLSTRNLMHCRWIMPICTYLKYVTAFCKTPLDLCSLQSWWDYVLWRMLSVTTFGMLHSNSIHALIHCSSHLVDRYCTFSLKEYKRIFKTNQEAGQLDNISRRFAWFHRLLQSYDVEQGRIFPAEWRVAWHLLAKFVSITG